MKRIAVLALAALLAGWTWAEACADEGGAAPAPAVRTCRRAREAKLPKPEDLRAHALELERLAEVILQSGQPVGRAEMMRRRAANLRARADEIEQDRADKAAAPSEASKASARGTQG